ncbi:unnamed protein product [Calypogeia fissa]
MRIKSVQSPETSQFLLIPVPTPGCHPPLDKTPDQIHFGGSQSGSAEFVGAKFGVAESVGSKFGVAEFGGAEANFGGNGFVESQFGGAKFVESQFGGLRLGFLFVAFCPTCCGRAAWGGTRLPGGGNGPVRCRSRMTHDWRSGGAGGSADYRSGISPRRVRYATGRNATVQYQLP